MDVLSGWPFYGSRGFRDEPGYGCYGTGSYPRKRPAYEPSNPFYSDSDWYPGMTHSPFHRHTKFGSPFDRRNHSMFCNPFEVDCQQKTRTSAKPKASVNRSPVEKQCEKPLNTMDATMATSTAPTHDKTENLSTSTKQVPVDSTSEAMGSQEQQATIAKEPKASETVLPELEKIQEIMNKSGGLEEKIMMYCGVPGSKEYIYIEESLMSILLQLDKIETNGNMEIRKARKSAVCKIQQMLADLENKAKDNMAASKAATANETSNATTNSDQDAERLDEEAAAGEASPQEVSVKRSHEEEMESSTLTAADLSNTMGALAAVNAEETACEAGIDDLVSEHSSVENVDPSIAVVTADINEGSAETAEDGVNSTKA